MGTSKNNPNRNRGQKGDNKLRQPTFYGFNSGFWVMSFEETEDAARADIRARMKTTKDFTVKPYTNAA